MVVKCSEVCCADVHDDPELDCTDFAHPAWWRGNDQGVAATVQVVNKMLDNQYQIGAFSFEPLNVLRDRIAKIVDKKP